MFECDVFIKNFRVEKEVNSCFVQDEWLSGWGYKHCVLKENVRTAADVQLGGWKRCSKKLSRHFNNVRDLKRH